jgi:integrase
MASIGYEGERGELKRITFRDASGKQKTLRLGKCSERAAQNALAGFERVLEAHRLGSTIHADGVRWLEAIDDRIHARVVALGLAQPRDTTVMTLGILLDRFDAAASVKPSTRAAYRQTTESLRKHLGGDAPLTELTPAHADGWRKAIAESGLAPATVAKRVHVARAIFKRAVRWGLIPSSPFADLRAGSQSNPERAYYVAPESIRAILAACPDDEWRAIVALSRYAGLRCPSEIVALRWGDVNWERLRLTVRSPKTAGHEGHAVRVVPIAPELRPILQSLFDRAEVGVEAVVPRLRDPAMNLRTTFGKIIARAGVTPWPRLFHNLRASCACDWVERFPAHVVAGWLGHSPLIAARHYLQTRDAHFDLATGGKGEPATNPATQAPQSDSTGDQAETQDPGIPADLVGAGVGCDPVESEGMGDTGLEPVTSSLSWKRASQLRQSPVLERVYGLEAGPARNGSRASALDGGHDYAALQVGRSGATGLLDRHREEFNAPDTDRGLDRDNEILRATVKDPDADPDRLSRGVTSATVHNPDLVLLAGGVIPRQAVEAQESPHGTRAPNHVAINALDFGVFPLNPSGGKTPAVREQPLSLLHKRQPLGGRLDNQSRPPPENGQEQAHRRDEPTRALERAGRPGACSHARAGPGRVPKVRSAPG